MAEIIGGIVTLGFILLAAEILTGAPSGLIQTWLLSRASVEENKRLRAENAELRKALTGVSTSVKALPVSDENKELRERIEVLETIATLGEK